MRGNCIPVARCQHKTGDRSKAVLGCRSDRIRRRHSSVSAGCDTIALCSEESTMTITGESFIPFSVPSPTSPASSGSSGWPPHAIQKCTARKIPRRRPVAPGGTAPGAARNPCRRESGVPETALPDTTFSANDTAQRPSFLNRDLTREPGLYQRPARLVIGITVAQRPERSGDHTP